MTVHSTSDGHGRPHRVATMGLRVGAQRVLNIDSSWDEAAKRLRNYSLFEVLNILGRISGVLHSATDSLSLEIQLRICVGLMGVERTEAIRRCIGLMKWRAARDGGDGIEHILFDDKSLWVLGQIASLELPSESRPTGHDWTELGEALLIVNDLIDESPSNKPGNEFTTTEGRRRWVYYVSAVALVPGTDPAPHLIARAAELFLTDHADLHEHSDYIDLPALFEEATGLSVPAYALATTLFLGRVYGINADNVATENATVPISWFRSEPLTLSEDEIDRFFRLGGMNATDFGLAMRRSYQVGIVRPEFNLPLEKSPLIRFPDWAVCLSVPLLEQRLTMGLYHVLLQARGGEENHEFRNRLQRFIGAVFQRYIDGSMSRIAARESSFSSSSSSKKQQARYIGESALRESLNGNERSKPCCDGILIVGDTAVLVEAKGKLFSLRARSGQDPEDFFKKLDDIVVRGLNQIESTIELLREGAFTHLGLSTNSVRQIVPLVVSMQPILMNPLLRAWLEERVSDKAAPRAQAQGSPAVLPWQLVSVGELEWLELLVESRTVSAVSTLIRKARDPNARGYALRNWGMAREKLNKLDANARLSFLGDRYYDIAERGKELFKRRRDSQFRDAVVSPTRP